MLITSRSGNSHRFFISMVTLIMLLMFASKSQAQTNNDGDTNALSGPNWRILDISYATERDRDSDAQADMLNLRASLPVMEYGLAAIELGSGETSNVLSATDKNAYQLSVMAGLRMAASEQADLFILAGATRVEMETNHLNISDDGFISRAGIRGRLGEKLDLSSYLQFSKVGGSSISSWHGDVRYRVFNRVDFYLGAGIYSRAWSGKVGVSLHF